VTRFRLAVAFISGTSCLSRTVRCNW